MNPQIGKGQPDHRLPSGEETQNPQGGYQLGQDGGQRCPAHAHIQHKDENGVQNDIQDGSDQHRQHTLTGEALGVDEIIHSQADHHKGASQQIDGQILVCIREGLIAGAEKIQQRFFDEGYHHRQYQSGDHQHGKSGSHDASRLFLIAFSPGDGEQR